MDIAEETIELVEFTLARGRYALEAKHVREVYPLRGLTPLPCTPSFILGIINVRGQLMAVTDLREFVDDSITSRMLLKNIPGTSGYDVKTAIDGIEGWTTMRNEDFDLVVTDVEMPRMDGLELTAKVRADERSGNMPVVLVTSRASREDRERGIDVSANADVVEGEFDQTN